MSKAVSIVINGAKLRNEFAVRKLFMSEVSEKCGFEKSYFSKCIREGKIGKPAVTLLDRMYNIKFEDYRIDDVREMQKTESSDSESLAITEEVSKVLYDIIYSAVYEAMKKALSE